MRLAVMLALTVLSGSICSAQGAFVNGADSVQSRVATLIDKLRSGDVQRIEIVQIPERVLTRTRVTPEILERSFHYKLIIRDIPGGAYGPGLTAAVTSISAEPSTEMGDLRWGVSFFDSNERLIESLYFDASGRRGAVGSLPASFKGDLLKWLDDNFSTVLK